MSGKPQSGEPAQPTPSNSGSTHDRRGESQVWSAISTLVAGPAVWGAIGWAVDHWTHTTRVFTPIGVVVGFITSIYVVYLKFGRD